MWLDYFNTWSLLVALSLATIAECGYNDNTPGQRDRDTSNFECKDEGYHADPENCKIYYRCVDYGSGGPLTKFKFECGPGTVFSKARGDICTHPHESERKECGAVDEQNDKTNDVDSNNNVYETEKEKPGYHDKPESRPPSPSPSRPVPPRPAPPSHGPSYVPPSTGPTTGLGPSHGGGTTGWDNQSSQNPTGVAQCQRDGFLADPADCSKFYRCVDQGAGTYRKHEFTCAVGTVWDPKVEACNHVWAANRVGCKVPADTKPSQGSSGQNGIYPAYHTDPNDPDSESPLPPCRTETPQQAGGQQGYPGADGHPSTSEESVPDPQQIEGQQEGPSSSSPSAGPDNGNQRPDTSEPQAPSSTNHPTTPGSEAQQPQESSMTQLPPASSSAGECTTEGFFANPNDCRKFYRCVSSGTKLIKYDFECGEGTVWDDRIGNCNHLYEVPRCNGGVSGSGDNASGTGGQQPDVDSNEIGQGLSGTSESSSSQGSNGGQSPIPTTGSTTVTEEASLDASTQDPTGNSSESPVPTTESSATAEEASPDASTQNSASNSGESSSSAPETSTDNGTPDSSSISTQAPTYLPVTQTERPSSSIGGSLTNGECTSEGFFADSHNCKKFYRCVGDSGKYSKYDFECGDGTAWDNRIQTCNHDYAVPNCGSESASTQSELPNGIPPSEGSSETSPSETPSGTPPTAGSSGTQPAAGSSGTSPAEGSSGTASPDGSPSNPPAGGSSETSPAEGSSGNASTESSSETQPAAGSSGTPSAEGSSGTASPDGSPSDPPAEGSSETSPAEGSSGNASTESSSGTQPAAGSSGTPSAEGSSGTASPEGSPSDPPAGGSSETSPAEGSSENAPTESSSGTPPSEGPSGNEPSESSSGTSPSEGSSVNQEETSGNTSESSSSEPATTDNVNDPANSSPIPPVSSTDGSPNEAPEAATESSSKPEVAPLGGTNAPNVSEQNSGNQQLAGSGTGCKEPGFFANPNDCTKFYRCVGGGPTSYTKYEFSCAPGTAWDQKILTCNHIGLVTTCNSVSNNEISPAKEENGQGSSLNESSGESDSGQSSSTENVSGVHETSGADTGKPGDMIKPPESSSESSSSSSESTSEESSGSSGEPCDKPKPASSNGIVCNKEGFYGNPRHCDKFYRCVNNGNGFNVYHFDCPPGTIFDPSISVCNYPDVIYPARDCEGNRGDGSGTGQSTDKPPSVLPTDEETTISGSTVDSETSAKPDEETTSEDSNGATSGEATPGSSEVTTDNSGESSTEQAQNTSGPEEQSTSGEGASSTNGENETSGTTSGTESQEETTSGEQNSTTENEGTSAETGSTTPTGEIEESGQSTTSGEPGESTTSGESMTSGEPGESTTSAESMTSGEPGESMTSGEPEESTTSGETSQEATTPAGTETSLTTPCPIGNLTGEQIVLVCPTGFKRHPKYCNIFYQCISESNMEVKILSFSCPDNTIFDDEKIQCLPESDSNQPCTGVKAGARFYRRVESSSTSLMKIEQRETLCPGVGHYPYNQGCSNVFYKCKRDTRQSLQGYVYKCPENFVYWSVSRRCERASRLPICSQTSYKNKNENNISNDRWQLPVENYNLSARMLRYE